MDFTAKENIPGLLLFIDFRKAFDSVEWEFLFESLNIKSLTLVETSFNG